MEFYIRPIKVEDAHGINELRRMEGVFENILGIPSERVKRNEDYIINMDEDTHNFVAVTKDDNGDEIIIGNAGLGVFSNPRTRHCAGVGMMVHKDYQGMGVGTKLLQSLLVLQRTKYTF